MLKFLALWPAFAKAVPMPYTQCTAPWVFAGPSAMVNNHSLWFAEDLDGGSDGDDDAPPSSNAGSAHRVAGGHDGVWFLATANGGVWRTMDIAVADPHWIPVTDNQPVTCTSMASLTVASFNPRLVAGGCGGSTSGEMGETWNELINGDWSGVMLSQDGGDNWAMTNFPVNYNVHAVEFLSESTMLVAARSNFFNANDGGVWRSDDLGKSWNRTFTRPAVDLEVDLARNVVYMALATDPDLVWRSGDGGLSWTSMANNLPAVLGDYNPYYSELGYDLGQLFLATFAVNPDDAGDTVSYVMAYVGEEWGLVKGTPSRMDQDRMPKDKIAVLPDPADPDTIYVAANAGALAYRVKWKTGAWTFMGANDTENGSEPHGDCRDLVWDPNTGNLLLTDDGGVFQRTSPREAGKGVWMGANGDIGTMEYLFAQWDNRLGRFVAGAQDNSIQITRPASSGDLRAIGVVGGDGTRTHIDNMHCPARMFGSAQFNSGFANCHGDPLKCSVLGIEDHFKDPHDFPYFVQAHALNSQDPGEFTFWVCNSTEQSRPSALYRITVPDVDGGDIDPVQVAIVPDDDIILDVVVGGTTDGDSDKTFLVAVSDRFIYHLKDGKLVRQNLPSHFARPVRLYTVADDDWVLGPLGHGNTMSLAVNPADSRMLAVTGWPVQWNTGEEAIWLTFDSGVEWHDIFGNLPQATGTTAKARPNGLAIIEFEQEEFSAILAATVRGVFVTFTGSRLGEWARVGTFSDLPIVYVASVSYEHYSDTLVGSTYGRGVWVLHDAKVQLLKMNKQQLEDNCNVQGPFVPQSSARLFPPQQDC